MDTKRVRMEASELLKKSNDRAYGTLGKGRLHGNQSRRMRSERRHACVESSAAVRLAVGVAVIHVLAVGAGVRKALEALVALNKVTLDRRNRRGADSPGTAWHPCAGASAPSGGAYA